MINTEWVWCETCGIMSVECLICGSLACTGCSPIDTCSGCKEAYDLYRSGHPERTAETRIIEGALKRVLEGL